MADGRDPGSRNMFERVVREPTLSDRVVASITEVIVSGKLKPGDRLQSERELGERFGVSRTVIREAIRSLAAHGLVESRPGNGVMVAGVGPEAVSRSMALFLRGNAQIDYSKVHEVRSAIEIEMTGTAAERADAEDLAALRSLLGEMAEADDAEAGARLDAAFHEAIAAATHNELYAVMLGSIRDLLIEIRQSALGAKGMLEYALEAHRSILETIEAHDPAAAREAMRTHLERSREAWSP